MITILHGDDIVSSRKTLVDLRQKSVTPFELNGQHFKIIDLVQITEGGSLFTNEKKLYIENFFSKRKEGMEFDEILEYVKKNENTVDITFWEGKEVSSKILKHFKKPKNQLFKLPQKLFSFLDSLQPNNGLNLIKTYHELRNTTEDELIFHMLIRQLRILIGLIDYSPDSIDEIKRLAPWQRQKLVLQGQRFTKEKLISLYKRLFDIDYSSKTGKNAMPLASSIDFFLIDL